VSTVFFAGGGTGGHLMPALAIADAMVRLDPSIQPFFVGGLRGVEANVLPQRPWPYELLPLEPLRRRQWWRNVVLPLSLARVVRRVRQLVTERRPTLVVGTGGYVAGPVVWTSVRSGVPAIVQEQNAFPGIATRRLAPKVRQIHLGFPEARGHLRPGPLTEVLDTGNPILPPPEPRPYRGEARRRLGLDPAAPTVLVVGGSQGALPINLAVDAAVGGGLWPAGVQLVWQTGSATFDRFSRREEAGRVLVRPFLDPVAEAYAAADVVVARAGAMTIAELCAWGLPSVLVPLPTAAAGHQLTNAKALAAAGAATLLEQHSATAQELVRLTCSLLFDPDKAARISGAARSRAHADAAEVIASNAIRLLKS